MASYNKVLYDPFLDRRQNLYVYNNDNGGSRFKAQAASVACFVLQKNITKLASANQYNVAPHVPTLSSWIQNNYKSPLGEKENFGSEKVLGYGTGFLITKNRLLTAAHVVCKENSNVLDESSIAQSYAVFDYCMEDADKCQTQFSDNQVYKIKKVVAHAYSRVGGHWEDWAVVKLERSVTGRDPFKLHHAPLQQSWELYMLGHPSGLPVKFTGSGAIMKNLTCYFECKVDACGGNSGSPLCRLDTGEVVGILCEGNTDYVIDNDYEKKGIQRCISNRMHTTEVKEYEKCQSISRLTAVKEYMDVWSTGFKLRKIDPPVEVQEPGLYVLGECQNTSCSTLNTSMWIGRGTGTFRLEEILYSTTCITCKSGAIKVQNTGIYKSRYELEGEVKEPSPALIRKQSVAQTALKTLDQGASFTWGYLKIKVTKI